MQHLSDHSFIMGYPYKITIGLNDVVTYESTSKDIPPYKHKCIHCATAIISTMRSGWEWHDNITTSAEKTNNDNPEQLRSHDQWDGRR